MGNGEKGGNFTYSLIRTCLPPCLTPLSAPCAGKVKISDLANSGCYCFASGSYLARYCARVIDEALVQLSQDGVGEYYTSGVIKAMLDDGGGGGAGGEGHDFRAILLEKSDMQVLGTPAQVADFCRTWPSQPALRFVFDLDNTLCSPPAAKNDYSSCLPHEPAIAYLRQVRSRAARRPLSAA